MTQRSNPVTRQQQRRTRAPRGTGSVYHRKDGRFEGCAMVTTAAGLRKRARVYGHTREQASEKLRAVMERDHKHIPFPDREWTVADYLENWLEHTVAIRCRPTTVDLYEATIRLHISPYIGKFNLTTLGVRQAQELINTLRRQEHSVRTLHLVRTVLSSALSRAQREELVFRNVARLVDLPPYERQPIRPWNEAEASRFLGISSGSRYRTGFALLTLYGLRRGEVLGLRWKDVDFARGEIFVRQQVLSLRGVATVGPLKTNRSRRILPLIPFIEQALHLHAHQHGIVLDTTATPEHTPYADQLILTSKTGQPVHPQNFSRSFKLFSAQAGLPDVTVHSIRHTAATLLKKVGIDPRDAQAILGHSSVTTTQQYYQHGDLELQRMALETISDLLCHSAGQEARQSQ